MWKKLIAFAVLCLTLTHVEARPLIRILEDEAEVVGAGSCKMANMSFDCVVLTHEGNQYTVLGTIRGDDFHALYIAKKVGEEWMIVWSWKGDT